MMNQKFKKGELVFLPSDITLVKFPKEKISEGVDPTINSWVRTTNPCHVLVVKPVSTELDRSHDYVEVLYEGTCWLARSTDIYTARRSDGS